MKGQWIHENHPRVTRLVGKSVNGLKAVRFIELNKRSDQIWEFECRCGKLFKTSLSCVKSGNTKSCGCSRPYWKHTETTWGEMVFSKLKANSIVHCWEWEGGKNSDGYGTARFRGRSTHVHRALFIYLYGELPEKICVLHRCDNRKCCNPFHWFTGTQKDNIDDAVKKGRQPRAPGENQWAHILTEKDVLEMRRIRRESGMPHSKIAERFGVATITACQAIIGHSWKHLPGAVREKPRDNSINKA